MDTWLYGNWIPLSPLSSRDGQEAYIEWLLSVVKLRTDTRIGSTCVYIK